MTRFAPTLIAAVLGFGAPAGATEHELDAYGPTLDACYSSAETSEALNGCRDAVSGPCMDREDGGQTTLGMSSCLMAEAAAWDRHLNDEYKATMAVFDEQDAEEAAAFPGLPQRSAALKAAQRAWIAFRDAECALAYAQWGAGSMRSIAGAGCRADMTATRTIELRAMREER